MQLPSAPIESTDSIFHSLSDFIVQTMTDLQIPGVAVGVLHQDQVHLGGFGVTSVENPLPVTPDTLFQIGSITKTYTATLAMRLAELGKLDLDAPVKSYLPDFRLRDKTAESLVTGRDLLTHMGGWRGDFFEETGSGDDAVARYVADMAELEQVVPPRTVWSYNNAGFAVMALIIEAVTGQTYEAALQEYLLDPLGLNNSFLLANDVISRRFVVGHQTFPGEGPRVERPWALARSAHAVGGLCSSVREQLGYAAFHLGWGKTRDGQQLLQPEAVAEMQRPHVRANLDRHMGLTWFLSDVGGARTVGHGGATHGQVALFTMVPERQFAVVSLTNSNDGGLLNEAVMAWALENWLGLTSPPAGDVEPPADLQPYVGRYEASLSTIELYLQDGQLMAQQIPHGGFPDKDSPPGPTPPPSRMAFFGPDRIIALDLPLKDMKAEFLRDESGTITWLRTTRLMRRV